MSAPHPTHRQRERTNVVLLAVWTLAWVATLAVAMIGPAWWGGRHPIVSWIAVVVNLLVGVGWIVVHARYLRGVDDLQRKIMLDAIAVAVGAGMVGGFAYAAADTADLVALDGGVAVLSVLMAVVYLAAIGVGTLRYR